MAIQRFDELNNLKTAADKWFSKMDVPKEEKESRARLSLEYCELIIMLFYLIEDEGYTEQQAVEYLKPRLVVIADKVMDDKNAAYINDWAPKKAQEIVEQTFKELDEIAEEKPKTGEKPIDETERKRDSEVAEEKPKDNIIHFDDIDMDVPRDEFPTSDARALLIGLNAAMTVFNFKELQKAVNEGKSRKVWRTMEDEDVRNTHKAVNGTDIPINDYFNVGTSVMLMPHDELNCNDLTELANCRCWLECY